MAILLEQLSVQNSKEMGLALQNDFNLLRVCKQQMYLEIYPRFSCYPSGAALMQFSMKMGPALQDELDLLRILEQLMCYGNPRISWPSFWSSL